MDFLIRKDYKVCIMIDLIWKIRNVIRIKFANRNYISKIKYLRKQGASIGEGTRLICQIGSFGTEPYLISVGKNCLFSDGIHLITHDGGVKVLSDLGYFHGERMDIIAPIEIGDNVYIATGAYIMPGVSIGDNCIIGANAVVTRDIPANSVAVGMPAKVIKSVDEYYQNAIERGRLFPTAQMSPREKKEFFLNSRNN